MDHNRNTDVCIDGKVYTLNGYEEVEYLQTVASYINDKIGELKKDRAYSRLNSDYQTVLLAMNLADDVFQARRQKRIAERKLEDQEKDTYQIRHELVGAQMKIQSLEEALEEAGRKLEETAQKLEEARQKLEEKDAEKAEREKELATAKKKITQLEEYKYRR